MVSVKEQYLIQTIIQFYRIREEILQYLDVKYIDVKVDKSVDTVRDQSKAKKFLNRLEAS